MGTSCGASPRRLRFCEALRGSPLGNRDRPDICFSLAQRFQMAARIAAMAPSSDLDGRNERVHPDDIEYAPAPAAPSIIARQSGWEGGDNQDGKAHCLA